MNRVASACFALVTSALVAGAMTSCAQLFDLPDGTLDDGGDGDGSTGSSPGSEGGTDGQADSDSTTGGDGGPRVDADGSTSPSDGATPGDAARDAGEGGASEGGASEAGADCAPAALSLYAEDNFDNLFRADFPDKQFHMLTADMIDCQGAQHPQHLAITRAGHGWLLGENGELNDLDLTDLKCSDVGPVTNAENFDDMSITFARVGNASTDSLYTCSLDGLGKIDTTTLAWSLLSDLPGIDHSLDCTIKPGRNGSLAILASTGDDPEYTLYEVDATGTILFKKGFGTAINDEGDNGDGDNVFDFAWSNSLYYIYGNDFENSVTISTFDPATGDIVGSLFDFTGQYFVTAGQSTCAQ